MEIAELGDRQKHAAAFITTTKDIVRIGGMRKTIAVLRVTVTWENEEALMGLSSRPVLRAPA